MENNNLELIGKVLDNQATFNEISLVICNMHNISFKECFITALNARALFNEKFENYDTIQ